jgi:hypothetical protein
MMQQSIRPYVDSVVAYTPEIIRKEGGGAYCQDYGDGQTLPANPGLNRIGMCCFKPWILLQRMQQVAQGDVLIYRDVNCVKYGAYLQHLSGVKQCAEQILSELDGIDVFLPLDEWDLTLRQHTKTSTLHEYFGAEDGTTAMLYNSPLLSANTIVVRNTEKAKELLQEWLDLMAEHQDWLLPNPNIAPDPAFRWLTPEQSIFTMMMAKKAHQGLIPKSYPVFRLQRRVFAVHALQRKTHT